LSILVGGQSGVVGERCRHQRRGLRARCKRDTASGKSKGEFQKVAALHHISSSVCDLKERVSRRRDERAVNYAFSFDANGVDQELFSRVPVCCGTSAAAAAFTHHTYM